jgi:ATP-dependent DNA helicase RecQ
MAESSLIKQRALFLLHQMLGPEADFRSGQWEAIEQLVINRRRVMVVQRTGWGKSIVYFLATKLLREQRAGFTLLISPLLALMRNQIQIAERIGVRAETINSSNRDEWERIETALPGNCCDLLLVSPERLNNPRFRDFLSRISGRVGLFVVDEVHCISDWGHDFRPDYQRIVRILRNLPKGVPVLGTTATANDRVVEDVDLQLGPDLVVQRGPLVRPSLCLQNIQLSDQSERLAWLAENLGKMPGTGIIYCLTIADTERVANWLRAGGFQIKAYHSGSTDREELEQALLDNKIKALVATVALGMGFDKPDLGFVVHFQRPGSVVAYYQQVGRAGRGLSSAHGVLLSGREDDEIQEYFIRSAFPPIEIMDRIVKVLERSEGLTRNEILSQVNVSYGMAEQALKLLELDGAVAVDSGSRSRRYFRTLNPWQPDVERVERVTRLRREELAQMQAYVSHTGCLMEFLGKALNDPEARPCGRCANCRNDGFSVAVSRALILEAIEYLRGESVLIEPRKQWPQGLFPDLGASIPETMRNAPGRALCHYGDAGWGRLVAQGKYVDGHFGDALVKASAQLILERWKPFPAPGWVAAIPSRRHPQLVPDFAQRLAAELGAPFIPALVRVKDAAEQKTMANSTMQARNVLGTIRIPGQIPSAPVLLVDDVVDSRWTLTMAGYLIRQHGGGVVHPFALACATPGKA